MSFFIQEQNSAGTLTSFSLVTEVGTAVIARSHHLKKFREFDIRKPNDSSAHCNSVSISSGFQTQLDV
jgi:hypothetical protein